MDEAPAEDDLPPVARYLKRLVTALTVVMIAGFLVLIAALVIRLGADPLPLPERISLPDGAVPLSFTQGTDWIGVVTEDDRIFVFDRATGELRQTIAID